MRFKDHFSGHASEYARFRPRYPAELFEYLAGLAPSRGLAWDCATGNGQAALALAEHFERVVATDASQRQLENAGPHPRVEYRQATAEQSFLHAESVDLVTVAQALHWFDIEGFMAEVRRVQKPEGIIAVWCYNLLEVAPEIDPLLNHFYYETVGRYWAAERQLVEDGYHSAYFPFREVAAPAFHMEAEWSLPDLLGYVGTWSATQNYIKARGVDPVVALGEQLAPFWGDSDSRRPIRWPLSLRVGIHEEG